MSDDEPTLVLVVDDDEFVRKSLGRNLRRLGCEVLLAADGDEALRIAAEAKPAVVFLDLRMPGMDGHTVLRRLSEGGVMSSVVVMSGQGDMDDVIEAVRTGAIDYMKKPWTTNELASVLARGAEVFGALGDQDAHRADRIAPGGVRIAARATNGSQGGVRAPRTAAVPWSFPSEEDPARSTVLGDIVKWLGARDVPGPPSGATVGRLREWARESTAPMDQVASLVERDRDLAKTVLRLANSTLRGHGATVSDVRGAVLDLGFRQVHGVAETIALRDGHSLQSPGALVLHERIWRFSVARGLAMRAIADITGPEIDLDGDGCYLAGLLLDVGASFLLGTLEGPQVAGDRGGAEGPVTANTISAMSAYHATFGQAILARWGMADIAALAGEHHGETAPVTGSALWCAAVSAGPLASRLVGADDPTSTHRSRPELLDRCAYSLGLGETVLRRLALALTDDVRELWAIYA